MVTLMRPPCLRPGDRVAVVAPAGPVPAGALARGLELLGQRYRIVTFDTLYARHGYLAGEDAARAEALNRAFRDPDVRAIFCARGGYGAMRILGDLDGAAMAADPKPVIGFSDVTALLHWVIAQGVVPFHGPVVTQLETLQASDIAHLFRVLENPRYEPVLQGRTLCGAESRVQGPLLGGNLAMLGALAGTRWAPSLEGAVLLLEEIAEPPYRVDRLLTTLRLQAGGQSAQGVAGVALGTFQDCVPRDGRGPSALEVVVERLGGTGCPVVCGLAVGHNGRNLAVPLGIPGILDAGRGTLRWISER